MGSILPLERLSRRLSCLLRSSSERLSLRIILPNTSSVLLDFCMTCVDRPVVLNFSQLLVHSDLNTFSKDFLTSELAPLKEECVAAMPGERGLFPHPAFESGSEFELCTDSRTCELRADECEEKRELGQNRVPQNVTYKSFLPP